MHLTGRATNTTKSTIAKAIVMKPVWIVTACNFEHTVRSIRRADHIHRNTRATLSSVSFIPRSLVRRDQVRPMVMSKSAAAEDASQTITVGVKALKWPYSWIVITDTLIFVPPTRLIPTSPLEAYIVKRNFFLTQWDCREKYDNNGNEWAPTDNFESPSNKNLGGGGYEHRQKSICRVVN